MALIGILNTARTLKQGATMHIAKDAPEYLEAISYVGVSAQEMEKAGIKDGDEVVVFSDHGKVTLQARGMELQPGSFFMPLSYLANRLVSSETHGTGVPGFKNTVVTIKKPNE
ncbi:MAG: protein fwdD [Nitrospinota bacterium]|nr:protein fwdD [Nitrospinota bacterium]